MIIWISPVSTKLLSDDSEQNALGRPITTVELSVLGALPQTGMLVGIPFLGSIFDKFGRRRCLNILNVLLIVSFVALAFAKHVTLYFVCIFIIGFLLGGTSIGVPTYLSEITEDHNRAKITCFMGLFMPIGNLYGFVLGSIFSIRTFTLLTALPSLLFAIISQLFLPESPTFLIMKRNKTEAIIALNKLLSRSSESSEEEANKIEHTLNQTKTDKSNINMIWTDRASRNAFIKACVLMILTIATGLPAIMSYLELVFEAAGTEVSASIYTIIVGVVQIVCYFAAGVLVEKWGRRPLLLLSAFLSSIPHFILGLYFYFVNVGSPSIANIEWVPVIGIVFLVATSVIGICSVAYAFMNEVFVSSIKATGIACVGFASGVILTCSVFLFPIMMETIGLAWTFWIYFICSVLGLLYIYYNIPETKGKNILEIQEMLCK